MKEWIIPIKLVCDVVRVKANTLKEAVEMLQSAKDDIPFEAKPLWSDDDWNISHENLKKIRNIYNDDQEDD